MRELIDKLKLNKTLSDDELRLLIEAADDDYLFESAAMVRKEIYSNYVYIRGLIEISNYCKNDCYYCGIRRSNANADRFRLSKEQIIECCKNGYELGFRTFVLQGGEDGYFTDEVVCDIVKTIKGNHPDCAVTLSLGEKPYSSYKAFYDAGADRYLLRHETACKDHYSKLHPSSMSLDNRKECLFNLKKIGFQTGSGFMVGSPYQTTENIVKDLRFLQELQPAMIGIGPYITHKDTPFNNMQSGSLELTLKLISILRLMFPTALIPATTALGTMKCDGRERGIMAGANVVMPNLSPLNTRKLYEIYDNKLCSDEEAAESLDKLKQSIKSIGYKVVVDRGDYKKQSNHS